MTTIHGRIDLATGEYTPYDQPEQRSGNGVVLGTVYPGTAKHEAAHAAAGLLLGIAVYDARADTPTAESAGHVRLPSWTGSRNKALMTLAGAMTEDDWLPGRPKAGVPGDGGALAQHADSLGLDQAGWEALVADAEQIVASQEFKELAGVIESLLERGLVLDRDRLELIHKSVGGQQLDHKTVKAATRTETDLGQFTAIAAAYTLDRDRERIVPGAFEKSLAAWRERGRPIPLHWSHLGDPQYIIGEVDPHAAREIREGLFVKGNVDLGGSRVAREAWRLVKSGTVGLSFGFLGRKGPKRPDGTRQIIEIDLYEVSLTPGTGQSRHPHPVVQVNRPAGGRPRTPSRVRAGRPRAPAASDRGQGPLLDAARGPLAARRRARA
jgi:Escherichia/Staphylococcus phage prohead protease